MEGLSDSSTVRDGIQIYRFNPNILDTDSDIAVVFQDTAKRAYPLSAVLVTLEITRT